jgi:hypothetical protein
LGTGTNVEREYDRLRRTPQRWRRLGDTPRRRWRVERREQRQHKQRFEQRWRDELWLVLALIAGHAFAVFIV